MSRCREEPLSITHQTPKSICQAAKCFVVVCSLVSRALIIGQRLNQGSEWGFPFHYLQSPHDPLTLLCSLRILAWDNRLTFNQLHPQNSSFLQATKLLLSRNALMDLRPSRAFFAPPLTLTLSKNHEDAGKGDMFNKVSRARFFSQYMCHACTHIVRIIIDFFVCFQVVYIDGCQ